MSEYRAYLIDEDGHISSAAIILKADTDEEAIEAAKELTDGHDVELWQAKRRVATLRRDR